MALLAAMAWRGIDGIARARDAGEAELQRMLRLTNVIAQWEADVRALRDTGAVPAIAFDGGTLRISRLTAGGVQMVAWTVKDGHWTRWASPAVIHSDELREWWMRSQQLTGGEAGHLTAAENLVGWNVQFFRVDSWTNAQSTGDVVQPARAGSAPTGTAQTIVALPNGVRVILQFAEGTLTRDMLVPPGARADLGG
jgi:general secretion pathway protein J